MSGAAPQACTAGAANYPTHQRAKRPRLNGRAYAFRKKTRPRRRACDAAYRTTPPEPCLERRPEPALC